MATAAGSVGYKRAAFSRAKLTVSCSKAHECKIGKEHASGYRDSVETDSQMPMYCIARAVTKDSMGKADGAAALAIPVEWDTKQQALRLRWRGATDPAARSTVWEQGCSRPPSGSFALALAWDPSRTCEVLFTESVLVYSAMS